MLPFDELNRLNKKNRPQRSIDIHKYFSEMELPESEIRIREEFAKETEDTIFRSMAYIYSILASGLLYLLESAKTQLADSITETLREYTYPDTETLLYIKNYANEFVETTVRNSQEYFILENQTVETIESDETIEADEELPDYWFSEDRARYNAENEANTIFNHEQYRQAKHDGLLFKQWLTMKDERVRETHVEVGDTITPIDQPFLVGDSLMNFPKDTSLGAGPEEVVNCRCTVRYF